MSRQSAYRLRARHGAVVASVWDKGVRLARRDRQRQGYASPDQGYASRAQGDGSRPQGDASTPQGDGFRHKVTD
jgi:hypothetical protein